MNVLPTGSADYQKRNPHVFPKHSLEIENSVVKKSLTTQPVEREKDLHGQILNYCRSKVWIALHGSMAERTHRSAGEPDFTILADGGRVFFIECKTKIGKLSPAQLALVHHANHLGHPVFVVRDFETFLEIIK